MTIRLRLTPDDEHLLSYWDSGADRWVTPRGEVPIMVGSSSKDICEQGTLTIR